MMAYCKTCGEVQPECEFFLEEGLLHDWQVEVERCPKCGRKLGQSSVRTEQIRTRW
jgi:hypothetical protein